MKDEKTREKTSIRELLRGNSKGVIPCDTTSLSGGEGDGINRGVTLDEKSRDLITSEYRKNDQSSIVELRCNIEGYYDTPNIVHHWLPWNKS